MTQATIKCNASELQRLAQTNHVTLLLVANGAKPDPMFLAVSDWLATFNSGIAKIEPISSNGRVALAELAS